MNDEKKKKIENTRGKRPLCGKKSRQRGNSALWGFIVLLGGLPAESVSQSESETRRGGPAVECEMREGIKGRNNSVDRG